ncbi:MAG TPA: DUF4236 domain-containing protein [Candidatus Acidoferrales bacterium]|nr:DUF4236 domain-containing protein [Candidatus Acidoferrales bacterium]
MGLRYQKRIRLAPGLTLNLSKRGVSLSVGRRGATLNVGAPGGPRATVGLPGTGLSYSLRLQRLRAWATAHPVLAGLLSLALVLGVVVVLGLSR